MDTSKHLVHLSPAVTREPSIADREAPGDTRAWTNDHSVDLRVSIPLPFGRWYVVVVAGRERRSAERRVVERRRHPLRTVGNIILVLMVGTVQTFGAFYIMQLAIKAAFN